MQTSEFDEATAQSIPQSRRAANAMGGLLEVAFTFAFAFVFTMGHRHVLTVNKCLGYFRKIRYKITKYQRAKDSERGRVRGSKSNNGIYF